MHSKTAVSGGARFDPTTSMILATSSGSVENLNVSPPTAQRPVLAPGRPGHGRVPDPQVPGQQPRRPERHAVLARRRCQSRRHDFPVLDRARLTRTRVIIQPGQALVPLPAAPADHRHPRHPDLEGNLEEPDPAAAQVRTCTRKGASRRTRYADVGITGFMLSGCLCQCGYELLCRAWVSSPRGRHNPYRSRTPSMCAA
jgi:hypothetical protein